VDEERSAAARVKRTVRWKQMSRLVDELRTGYWFLPMVCVVLSAGAAVVCDALDHAIGGGGVSWAYAGGPRDAIALLTTIASSMITFTGLVFSITLLALQLTSSQFSPRALRNFLRDRTPQLALGIFVGTFTYAFVALVAIRAEGNDRPGFVPSLTVTGSLVLVAASIVLFIRLIHHVADSVRAVSIIERIARETRASIEHLLPTDREAEARPRPAGAGSLVASRSAGVVTDVDLDRLAKLAAEYDAYAEVVTPIGHYVCTGQPLVRVIGGDEQAAEDRRWHEPVRLDKERTMREDPAFGLRQLVDIAERALSPGVNDPTTAMQCLDRIHDLLRMLAARPMPEVAVASAGGAARAWAPLPRYADLVHLGVAEIRASGHGTPRIRDRVDALLDDLLMIESRPDRRAVLVAELSATRSDLAPQPAPLA
jgi:uncharacterized membrane protein